MKDYPIFKKTTCKHCKGTGVVTRMTHRRFSKYPESVAWEAANLVEQGKSYREAAKILGINHPQTVKNLAEKYLLVQKVRNRG